MVPDLLSTAASDEERPALLGGCAVRPPDQPAWPPDDPAVMASLQSALAARLWGVYEGENSRRLVAALQKFLQIEHVLLCSSGTSAVELGLRGLNVQPGDEVILAGVDFKGNFLNVIAVGAIPVLVDVERETGQLNLDAVNAAIHERTRAVIATHLHGGMVNMPALREIADRHGIGILEDACQMPGALVAGRRAGTWGDVGVFSFGGTKLLCAGRGGSIFTMKDEIAARIRRWKIRGSDASPLSELQTAALIPQIAAMDRLRAQRQQTVAAFAEQLTSADCLIMMRPGNPAIETDPDFYKIAFRYLPQHCSGLSRERLIMAMQAEGLPLFPGFRGLHVIHARARFRQPGSLEVSTEVDQSGVLLHHPMLLEGPIVAQQFVQALRKIQRHAEALR